MAKMRNSLATIVFVVLAFSTSSAQSRITRECVDFSHSYCNRFNYSTAIFPNPRGHETPEEAASEFSDFYGLLNNNACHPKLGTLLCFIYFPLCNKANYNSEDPLVDGFFPCQELCEEVHASVCNDIILRNVGSWAPHLRCNFTDEDSGKKYYQNAISLPNPPNCVNGIAPRFGKQIDS